MLYVLHGTDTIKARQKLTALVESLQVKKPDASLVRIDEESFDESELEHLIRGQGLFEQRLIIVCDEVFKNVTIKEKFLSSLKDISSTENIFLLIEEDLDKKTLTKLTKHANKVQEFQIVKQKKNRYTEFNVFALSDALGTRDKQQLWVLYQKGKARGIADEEMHGILLWGIKSILLARSAGSAQEAGLNPFVFKKAVRFGENFSQEELQRISSQLVSLYHDARRGIMPLDIALEQFILAV